MLSPSYRMAPPVRPSRSLEGLERVIPPFSPLSPKTPFSPRLFLNKPLPAQPLPEEPECSAMWSDSSDSESTVDSIAGPSEPRDSVEYPIFVSGADDFDLVDHPAPSADPLPVPPLRTDNIEIDEIDELDEVDELDDVASIAEEPPLSVSVSSSWSDTQYGRPVHWAQNRPGTSHYFREKKWDYFPELAPSALQARGSTSLSTNSKRKKNLSALDFTKAKYRWHSLDRTSLGGVRESIKTYVHRTLSRDGTESKAKEVARPSTAPMDRHIDDAGSTSILGTSLGSKVYVPQHSSLDVDAPCRAISVSTASTSASAYSTSTGTNARVTSLSASDYDNPYHHMYYPLHSPLSPVSPTTRIIPRQKQLAVPMSPYQKYGSSIWETPKKSKKRGVQFPKYSKSPSSPTREPEEYPYPGSGPVMNASQVTFANPTPPLSPPLKSQLLQNTRGAVKVLQGKRNSESKEEKRRELLKAQIKFVGPVNPHTYGKDSWV